MRERIVRTEVGLKLFKEMAEEEEQEQQNEAERTQSVLKDQNAKDTQNGEQGNVKKLRQCKRLITSLCMNPSENNGNYDNLWMADSSIYIHNNYKKQIQQNCKDQSSFQKYFSEKNISNPYIQKKIKNISQKLIPIVEPKYKSYIIKNAVKNIEKNNNSTITNKGEQGNKQSALKSFLNGKQKDGVNSSEGSSSTSKESYNRIYERIKKIQDLDKALLDDRSIRLVYLEQKIDQLSMRQHQYESYRQNLNINIHNKLSDVKSFVYQPPTLQEMKQVYGDPQDLLNYNEKYKQLSQKQIIAKIHQRKYSENWKKEEELRQTKLKNPLKTFRTGQNSSSLFFNHNMKNKKTNQTTDFIRQFSEIK